MMKLYISLLIGCVEWMFLGMSFFLNWNIFIELFILAILGSVGYFTFISWFNKMEGSVNDSYANTEKERYGVNSEEGK